MRKLLSPRQEWLHGLKEQGLLERACYISWWNEWDDIVIDSSEYWYDCDDLQQVILDAMYDKVNHLEDGTVSVREIARLFKRDTTNIRYSFKSMEKKGWIVFVGNRLTSSGRIEKTYMEKQLFHEVREDQQSN